MEKQKKPYAAPTTDVNRIEIESSICSGSVEFGEEKKGVTIKSQEVANITNNDFTSEAWDTSAGN